MKSYMLVFALATVLFYTEYIIGIAFGNVLRNGKNNIHKHIEICSRNICVTPEKCEQIRNKSNLVSYCSNGKSVVCCDVCKLTPNYVKAEYRTHCRHHGGECMYQCGSNFQIESKRCHNNKVCCILTA